MIHTERRARALAAMADAGVDALVLGREANARYVAGATRLWLAGARAFAPGCVLLRDGDVHLLSAGDDGIPDDVPVEHLYPLTWNPANLMARLAAIPGLANARTIGVDGLTPLMDSLFAAGFPRATLVDGHALLRAVRREKLSAEIDAIRGATSLAARALGPVIARVQPGARECDLRAAFEQSRCDLGTTVPAFDGTFGSVFPSARALEPGERVVLDVGVLLDGYEGGLARTIVCGEPASRDNPADGLFTSVLDAIRPGATAADVWTAWDATGVARPAQPVVHGVGLGFEPPVIGDDDEPLADGMTLSVRAERDGWVRRDVVAVTPSGARVLVVEPS